MAVNAGPDKSESKLWRWHWSCLGEQGIVSEHWQKSKSLQEIVRIKREYLFWSITELRVFSLVKICNSFNEGIWNWVLRREPGGDMLLWMRGQTWQDEVYVSGICLHNFFRHLYIFSTLIWGFNKLCLWDCLSKLHLPEFPSKMASFTLFWHRIVNYLRLTWK